MATITIEGPVEYDDGGGKYADASLGAGPIADYMIRNRYERDLHRYMGGLTSPQPFNGATVGVVQIGGPTLLWVAEWTACKPGENPPVPDPGAPDGWVLMDAIVSAAPVTVMADGQTPLYRINGTYVYACLAPSADIFDDVRYPQMPWVQGGAFNRKVPTSALDKTLLTPDNVSDQTSNPVPTGTTSFGSAVSPLDQVG